MANIILNLINKDLGGVSIFNVGNKKALTIREWVESCSKVVGKQAKIVEYDYIYYNRNERDFFPFFSYDNVLDVSKINEIYSDETDFETGLRNCFEWYSNNVDNISFKENISLNEKEILEEIVQK